jgi:Phage integrase family
MRTYESSNEYLALRDLFACEVLRRTDLSLSQISHIKLEEISVTEFTISVKNFLIPAKPWLMDFWEMRKTTFLDCNYAFPSLNGTPLTSEKFLRRITTMLGRFHCYIHGMKSFLQISENEWSKIADQISFHYERQKYQVAIAMGLLCIVALRPSEVSALKKKDLNFEEKTIYLEMTKKGRSDIMPIPDIMMESLIAYAKHLGPNDRLFVKLSNSPWMRQDVLRIAKTFGNQLGIQEVTPRRLRNTVARQLRKNGATLDQVRNFLRHTEERTTIRHYAPDEVEQRRETANKLHPINTLSRGETLC